MDLSQVGMTIVRKTGPSSLTELIRQVDSQAEEPTLH